MFVSIYSNKGYLNNKFRDKLENVILFYVKIKIVLNLCYVI